MNIKFYNPFAIISDHFSSTLQQKRYDSVLGYDFFILFITNKKYKNNIHVETVVTHFQTG